MRTAKEVANLDDDEKGVSLIHTHGGPQEMVVVRESGLYALILRSRAAMTPGTVQHRFRKWVTSEVLPAIRKTGSYGANQPAPAASAASTTDLQCRYTVREQIVRPDGPWGRIWAIPIYRIDGLDYWNVHVVLEAYCGLRYVPDDTRPHENAYDLIKLHPNLIGGGPLWVARGSGLATIVRLAGGCWDVRARDFMHQLSGVDKPLLQ